MLFGILIEQFSDIALKSVVRMRSPEFAVSGSLLQPEQQAAGGGGGGVVAGLHGLPGATALPRPRTRRLASRHHPAVVMFDAILCEVSV